MRSELYNNNETLSTREREVHTGVGSPAARAGMRTRIHHSAEMPARAVVTDNVLLH